ncbi:hypothetical protein D3C77_561950 [compost metagenome]
MPQDHPTVAQAQGTCGLDVLKVTSAKELGSHHIHQCQPGKQRHDPQQPPEVWLDEAAEDDQQVEHRQARPDLQNALPDQVDPTSVVALQGAGGNADHRADQGQRQGK